MELNKTAGINAIPALNNGTEFRVGNYYGADNSVILRNLANEQIADAGFRLRIMQTGVYELNGFTESLRGRNDGTVNSDYDALGLEVGSSGSGDVNLGGGIMNLNNATTNAGLITQRYLPGGVPAAAATISNGTLNLFGATGSITRMIRVDDTPAIDDLVISAVIADGGATGTVQKEGDGRLVLSGNNTFASAFIANRGETVAKHNNAFGSNVGLTTVNSGFSVLIDGSAGNLTLAENFSINGTGFGGRGALVNLAGDNTLNGTMALAAAARIGIIGAADTLTQVGAISGAFTLSKYLPGTFTIGGGAADVVANTNTTTEVVEGIMILNKAVGTAAVVNLSVGGNDGTGGAGADIARLARSNQITGNCRPAWRAVFLISTASPMPSARSTLMRDRPSAAGLISTAAR